MKTSQIVRNVGIFFMCATICQSGTAASSSQERAPKPTRIAGSKLLPRQTYDSYGVSHSEGIGLEKKRGWLDRDVSVLAPVPKQGMLIGAAGMLGSSTQSSANFSSSGSRVDISSSGSSFGTALGLMYGITDAVFMTGNLNYQPGKSDSEIITTTSKSNSTSKDSGMREPEVSVAFAAKAMPGTRLISELGARIPVGPATDKGGNNEYSHNGLEGGGAIKPRVTVVSDLGGVKFVGNLTYRMQLERKSERERSGTTSTETMTGGNSSELQAGVELPRAGNLGFSAFYGKYDGKTTKSQNLESTTPDSTVIGAYAYAGLKVPGSNLMLMPRLAYLTSQEKSSNNVNIERNDNWIFGIQGLMHF